MVTDIDRDPEATVTTAAQPAAADQAPDQAVGQPRGADDGAGERANEGANEAEAPRVESVEPAEGAESAEPADASEGAGGELTALLEREGDIAADYLEELLDIADLDGDIDMDVEGERAAVSIVGADLSQLVGRDGEVLDALQELTRLAVYRETGVRSRLMLDIGEHRAHKKETLEAMVRDVVTKVQGSGEAVSLDPMTAFERKVVHDAVAAAGLRSESDGVEPRRFVVVRPLEAE